MRVDSISKPSIVEFIDVHIRISKNKPNKQTDKSPVFFAGNLN